MQPHKPLRIAILEADLPLPNTQRLYGTYAGAFASLLHKAAAAEGFPRSSLQLSGWDVVNLDGGEDGEVLPDAVVDGSIESPDGQEIRVSRRRGYPPSPLEEAYDAILITGSKYNAFDNSPWIIRLVEFTRRVLQEHAKRVRVIGVCFGHQIVARALGCRVGLNDKNQWEASVCEVRQTPRGKEVFTGTGNVLRIFQSHKDIAFEYPEAVDQLGSSEVCAVQGMYRAKEFITVQGHPEFTETIMRELLVARHKQGVFSDEVFRDAQSRVADAQDGVLVAQAFLRLLLD